MLKSIIILVAFAILISAGTAYPELPIFPIMGGAAGIWVLFNCGQQS